MTNDTVYIVERGNRQTKTASIVEVYDDEEAAYTHMYALIFKGRASGRHDYVDVRERTVKSELAADVEPNFDYRVAYKPQFDLGAEDDHSGWVDTYEEARDIAADIRDGKNASDIRIQRRNARGDIEETERFEEEPWDNRWREV